jgi:hypothetical protein
MTARNGTCISAFLRAVSRLEEALDRIKAASMDHFGTDPDHLTWADVASATRYAEQAKLLADEITQTGEFAA